jgi:hypothetical protein
MIIINMLMRDKLNSITHLRALLVLHDRGILAHATSITPPTEVTQILALRLGYYDSGTRHSSSTC